MNIEEIKNYIAANPDDKEIQSLLNSHADKRVTAAIKTYQEKNEAEKLKALELQISQLQQENTKSKFKSIITEKGLPEELAEFIQGSTEEEISTKADQLLNTLNSYVQKGVENGINLKLSGRPPVTGATAAGVSIANIKNMSSDEILKNLDQLNIGK